MASEYNIGPQERFILPSTTAESTKARPFPTSIFSKPDALRLQFLNAVVNFQNTWWEHRFWIELVTTGATNSTPLLYTPNQGASELKTL
jgi:hypothetical protein